MVWVWILSMRIQLFQFKVIIQEFTTGIKLSKTGVV
jgi:hypothetical protein